ncbi:molybdopterin-dependent oxidoreductase [Streptomyces fradiae]|uniref:molybdopterin-dependent oxidoreductase n=1 Tax=Streptomyces fradiae TaxID=1906 RepID=UPI0036970788
MSTLRRILDRAAYGAACGLPAAFTALAVAELAAALVRPEAGPVTVVGGAAIDRTPAPVKDWAIRSFGEADKLVLQVGILAVLAGCAVLVGVLAPRRRLLGAAVVLAFGAVGAAAALSRPDSRGAVDALPSLVGGAAGAVALYLLAGLAGRAAAAARRTAAGGAHADRVAVGGAHADPVAAGGAHCRGDGRGGADADGRGGAGGGGNDVAATGGAAAGGTATGSGGAPGAESGGGPAPAATLTADADAADADGTGADAADADGTGAGGARTASAGPGGGPRRARRTFLAAALATTAAATGAGALGRTLTARRARDAVASREALRLPAPASPAPPLPAGSAVRVPGVAPFTTPDRDFYRVDTALVVPRIDAGTWRLRLHGEGVARPRTYSLADLLARPLVERDITLTCVSNEVGGPYVGTARWLGVPLAELLREAGVRPPSRGGPADQLVARSVDGMTIGTPVEDVMDGRDALLAVGINGAPLSFERGFPVRMVVPGLYGYVSACKWIEEIELTTFAGFDAYWVRRKWARRAPVKTQSRIDTPRPFSRPAAGVVMVAGVAWAQRRGIARVEVRVDDGPWQDARLAAQGSVDTWRQWSYAWRATPGGHTLTVRATDGTGAVQTERRTRTVPDGASGRHSVFVTVADPEPP